MNHSAPVSGNGSDSMDSGGGARRIPVANVVLMSKIIELLGKINHNKLVTHMDYKNLAVVFAPSFLRPHPSSIELAKNIQLHIKFVSLLIKYPSSIFYTVLYSLPFPFPSSSILLLSAYCSSPSRLPPFLFPFPFLSPLLSPISPSPSLPLPLYLFLA